MERVDPVAEAIGHKNGKTDQARAACEAIAHGTPMVGGLTREAMPDWWPEHRPPQYLEPGHIYRGRDGRWYDMKGRTYNRAQRRARGAK